MHADATTEAKPLVQIGWILAADVRDNALLDAYEQARCQLQTTLAEQFPHFHWQVTSLNRRRYAPRGALQPLQLLNMAVQEKLHHNWDYALIIVPNELNPQQRTFTLGVPSSALEVAAISSALADDTSVMINRLVGLALHLLGHLWGLEHTDTGPMQRPTDDYSVLTVEPFSSPQQKTINKRLEDVADARLEEQQPYHNLFWFYLRTFLAEPRGILTDIWGYSPWWLPIRAARLTAAAVVTLLVLLLTAESWEMGINFALLPLSLSAIAAIISATIFIFVGQHLGQVSNISLHREQQVRTNIVLFITLLLGMMTIWIVLFGLSYLATFVVPSSVISNWTNNPLDAQERAQYAVFMATIGVVAGALGGNLEDKDELKADLLFDEET